MSVNWAVISFIKAYHWCSLGCGALCFSHRCLQLWGVCRDFRTSVAVGGIFQTSEAQGRVLEVLRSHRSSWRPGWLKVLGITACLSKPCPTVARASLSAWELSTAGSRPIVEHSWISLAQRYKLVAQREVYLNIFFPLDWHKEGVCSLPSSPRSALCMCKSCPWPQTICLHFIINAELNLRQIPKDDFLNRCCRSLVSYLSNKFQSASRCFCHCNQRSMLFSSSNYKARATQGKFILFKSVSVSPNSLLCH